MAPNQERLDWRRDYAGPEFLKEGFRPLFMAAGIWAALAAPLWVAVWTGVISYDGAFAPQVWHTHENDVRRHRGGRRRVCPDGGA